MVGTVIPCGFGSILCVLLVLVGLGNVLGCLCVTSVGRGAVLVTGRVIVVFFFLWLQAVVMFGV